ncbi:hypothetical protein ZWY2020_035671 [Hordeum vulgare]|nr:hypothetical protein ZWY2020_035671 [Hordeum vulgare]
MSSPFPSTSVRHPAVTGVRSFTEESPEKPATHARSRRRRTTTGVLPPRVNRNRFPLLTGFNLVPPVFYQARCNERRITLMYTYFQSRMSQPYRRLTPDVAKCATTGFYKPRRH